MARLILLDATPLGQVARPGKNKPGDQARIWIADLVAGGARVYIPEVADYEVRRKLIQNGATAGVDRLDELKSDAKFRYLPITTAAMLKAAEIWAAVRRAGLTTAGPDSLDADAILAGQALTVGSQDDAVMIATANQRHLARFPGVHAELWSSLT